MPQDMDVEEESLVPTSTLPPGGMSRLNIAGILPDRERRQGSQGVTGSS